MKKARAFGIGRPAYLLAFFSSFFLPPQPQPQPDFLDIFRMTGD
jgi:radical SAM superfamily enzyme with C-terminal helix-hairpin-helix motif